MTFDQTTINMLLNGIWETVYMVFLSSLLSYVIGIPPVSYTHLTLPTTERV